MTPRLAIGSVETPIGRHWIAVSPRGVLAIDRDDSPLPLVRWLGLRYPGSEPTQRSPLLDRALAAVAAYLATGTDERAIPLDTGWATRFDREVWQAVRAIPLGETTSYGAIAASIGRPRAARAVGSALARCPLSPLVPCHRVIHAGGDIGGWGGDIATKRWLLALEATSSPSPRRRSGRTRRPPVSSR